MYGNDCENNPCVHVFILVIETLSVFCFALSKTLSMTELSRKQVLRERKGLSACCAVWGSNEGKE